jgi:hypothetical protein
MLKQDKIDYMKSWKAININMLIESGLDLVTQGPNKPSFVTGVFFSLSTARSTVPHLQQFSHFDACHTSFGKYTLHSAYGNSANANTSCIGCGIMFGSESKENWLEFLNFIHNCHPTLNTATNTYISDQCKGLIESIKEVLPTGGSLHCSFHWQNNIDKVVKGGRGPNLCKWLYNKLMQATNVNELEKIKRDNAVNVSDKALNYLNSMEDVNQYPAARCAMGEGIYLYNRTASTSVESMNHANKEVSARTAVDVVNASILLLQLECKQFKQHQESAWKRNDYLTPHGNKLRDLTFKQVPDYCLYTISVNDSGDRCNCQVVRQNERRCWFMKVPVMGSLFGGCTCGGTLTAGVPCHHMVAVVKSSRILGLNESNAMPKWWTTEMWRLQYPQEGKALCDFDMTSIKVNHTPDTKMRYCPPYAMANKAGRPKTKRIKSCLEGNIKKRKATIAETIESEQKKKSKKSKSGGKTIGN